MKSCYICKETKALDCFYKHPGMSDGHLNKCKECHKLHIKNNRESKADYYHWYDRERGRLPKRVAGNLERERKAPKVKKQARYNKWRNKNPDKIKAEYTVNNAIRDGRMQKQPCSICGLVKAQAHHEDYSKPLDVVWLCTKHHGQRHREIRDMNRVTFHKRIRS